MAFHGAGYATAIHLGNRQKQLPAIHFQIEIKPLTKEKHSDAQLPKKIERLFSQYTVKVEGGRLIQSLPLCFSDALQDLTWFQQAEYRCAFEADVSNILTGLLAEAKYMALQDGEAFNANLIGLDMLRFYNNSTNIGLINSYMECYQPNNSEREQKLIELFLAAFKFIDDESNWQKISALAEFIHNKARVGIIHCEEVISLLNSEITLCKTHSSDLQTMKLDTCSPVIL
jgi:hypothetical protein